MEKARMVLKEKLPDIQAVAERVVREQGSGQSVKVEFGKVQFPTKLYGEFLYPAGEYQAILITLGEGTGANWWCVLYPPLCFLDFSNGVAVQSDGFEDSNTALAAEIEEEDIVEEQVNNVKKKKVEVITSSKKNIEEVSSEKKNVEEVIEKEEVEVEEEKQPAVAEVTEKEVPTVVEKD